MRAGLQKIVGGLEGIFSDVYEYETAGAGYVFLVLCTLQI